MPASSCWRAATRRAPSDRRSCSPALVSPESSASQGGRGGLRLATFALSGGSAVRQPGRAASPRCAPGHRRREPPDAASSRGSTPSRSWDREEDRMSAGGVGLCDDGANPCTAADDVMVEDVEGLPPVPRALLQSHGKDHPAAAARESDLELLTDSHRRYSRHHVSNATEPPSVQS